MARVAINGLGRIGRATLKIVMDTPGLDLVAANDIGEPDNIAYLLKYDSVYGRYEKTVDTTDVGTLTIGNKRLTLLREEDPSRLPWASLSVDIVFECTGAFTRRHDLDAHIRAGARYVTRHLPPPFDRGRSPELHVKGSVHDCRRLRHHQRHDALAYLAGGAVSWWSKAQGCCHAC
jgi:glyceraldehyde 3-phosphate dehydrogenase